MMRKRKVDIIEVANHAGVSKSTVSRVVSDCGGAGLRTKKTWLVLIMVPDIANPSWPEVVRAAAPPPG
jgi:DNA-binding LacI/PurR family transcriptional regulator